MSLNDSSLVELFPSEGGCTGGSAAELIAEIPEQVDTMDLEIPESLASQGKILPENKEINISQWLERLEKLESDNKALSKKCSELENENSRVNTLYQLMVTEHVKNKEEIFEKNTASSKKRGSVKKSKRKSASELAAPRLGAENGEYCSDNSENFTSIAEITDNDEKPTASRSKSTKGKTGSRRISARAAAASKKLHDDFTSKTVARTYVADPRGNMSVDGDMENSGPIIKGVIRIPPPAIPRPITPEVVVEGGAKSGLALEGDHLGEEEGFSKIKRKGRKLTNEQAAVQAADQAQQTAPPSNQGKIIRTANPPDNESTKAKRSSSEDQPQTTSRGYVPPITICDEVDFRSLRNAIMDTLGHSWFLIIRQGERLAVKTNTIEERKRITEMLTEEKVQHFTHDPASAKRKKMVLNTVPGLSVEEIKSEIIDKSQMEENKFAVTKLKSKGGGEGGSFLVSVPKSSKVAELKRNVQDVMNAKVQWRKFTSSGRATQCYRYQRFGHGRANCGMLPRCLICAENHESASCPYPKDRREHVRCCNCNLQHTANFSGCESRKDFELNMLKAKRAPAKGNGNHEPAAPRTFDSKTIAPGISYAGAAGGSSQTNNLSPDPSVNTSPTFPPLLPTKPPSPPKGQLPLRPIQSGQNTELAALIEAINETSLSATQKSNATAIAERIFALQSRSLRIASLGALLLCLDGC